MPFKSKAQARYLYAKLPEIARRFAEKGGPSYGRLPGHVKPKRRKRRG